MVGDTEYMIKRGAFLFICAISLIFLLTIIYSIRSNPKLQ